MIADTGKRYTLVPEETIPSKAKSVKSLTSFAKRSAQLAAGLAHMGRLQFLLYTCAGTTIWNIILIGAGYYLGANFSEIERFTGPFTIATIAVVVAAYVWRVVRWQPRG